MRELRQRKCRSFSLAALYSSLFRTNVSSWCYSFKKSNAYDFIASERNCDGPRGIRILELFSP